MTATVRMRGTLEDGSSPNNRRPGAKPAGQFLAGTGLDLTGMMGHIKAGSET